MENKDFLITWIPVKNIDPEFFVQSIVNDENGLTIALVEMSNRTRKIVMQFAGGVRSYRVTDELLSINALQGAVEVTEEARQNGCLPMFKVINSEYMEWAAKRSQGISNGLGLTHFAVGTIEATVEIITLQEK